MSDPIYRLEQVQQRYGARDVVVVDELTVHRGEIFALVGPSGAGKSTLLRLLNFLETPATGVIHFDGATIAAGEEASLALRRRVTTVFQRPVLLRHSVEANVGFGLQLRGQRGYGAAVQAALAEVGLAHLARRPARTLSGGEAQRVALARAMVLQPTALLLDEPTANLDPYNVGIIEGIVRRLNEEQGLTVVLVTHNLHQARRLAHRMALMLEGRIVEVGDVHALFEAPQDPRTAAFVRGEMIY
jgi:tungstate transport system ATP-binding protein